ncbi:MAG: uracil-DNA glycosylase [bacterium]|nr:uracil-DNA glycosylase [bacterium]
MDKTALLADIAKKIEVCQRCELWKGTTHAVPGEGNPEAKVVFIGEGPGFYEDQQGRPFVGRAGILLNQVLGEIGMKREEVFIGNVVKHRPPENRDPLPAEISACRLWLDQQVEIIRPKLIVTLGRYSLARYLPSAKISFVHGQVVRAGNQVVLPMYHPAAALRSTGLMEAFKKDFHDNSEVLKDPDHGLELNKPETDESDPQMGLF